jgi:glycerophosphoryl diester phosphodiesterase
MAASKTNRGLKIVLALFLSLLIVLVFGAAIALNGSTVGQPQLIAHRGGPAYQPENTMAAFQQAALDGAGWLEFDVQMTQDGTLVVIHDDTVDRTTDGTGAVAGLTLAEVQALDAGKGERVPTFGEVIAFAKERGLGILPEAKQPGLYPGIEEKLVKAIEEAGYLDRTIVQSFSAQTLDRIHKINPGLRLCKLYGLWDLSIQGTQPGQAAYICPMAEMVLLNPAMLRQVHRDGRQAFVWFGIVEHPLIMRLLLWLGADGLMVDDPKALADLLER